jgi:ribosomal protein RSM22 (predicted rRNA methylase)
MHLPEELKKAIEEEVRGKNIPSMAEGRREMTERYRDNQNDNRELLATEIHRHAYLAARMPATFAAVKRVLIEVQQRIPDLKPESLLDLGAGPGTVLWAAHEIFPDIKKYTLVEKDRELVSIGKRLASRSSKLTVSHAQWLIQNLEQFSVPVGQDIIVLSYAVGELGSEAIAPLIKNCWLATEQLLVIVEPGTPAGFERIRSIRSQLIDLGAHMVAPCPHEMTCPMVGKDWCHFSERLARTSLHRQLKGGDLGYEDEKYSYVVVSKTPCLLPQNRVLRHPMKRSGHVVLNLCTGESGLKQLTVSKRNPELYRQAKAVDWGSIFPSTSD